MQKDFYLNERSTAAYFEKDWYDFVVRPEIATKFSFAPFPASSLYDPYHERLIKLLRVSLDQISAKPRRLLEIGSSLGRTFFEVCRNIPSVETARLFEPSQNLWRTFNTIFSWPSPVRINSIKGNGDLHLIDFATDRIRSACTHVEWTCENQSFQEMQIEPKAFDLVICSNVIDQCHDPNQLVQRLKAAGSLGGVLALSCTYQWQSRYTGNAARSIGDIQDLFGAGWRLLGEENIPFEFRVNERHWMKFLSHACIFQKSP